MSGILIKGTIQIQDSESVVAYNTGKLASNDTYVNQIVCITATFTSANDCATGIQNKLNDYLPLNGTLLSQNIVHHGTDYTYFLTFSLP